MTKIFALDTEWGCHHGRIGWESAFEPVLLCAVELATGQRFAFYGRDPALRDFFADNTDALFVAHAAQAEMKYLLRLGIPLPACWFDTYVAWRLQTNRPNPPAAGLSFALHSLKLPHLAPETKKQFQQDLLNLRLDLTIAATKEDVTEYCFSDCLGTAALFNELRGRVDAQHMDLWMEYTKSVAAMELRGIPFDHVTYHSLVVNKHTIQEALAVEANGTWPVFTVCPDSVKFSRKQFLKWCRTVGLKWPANPNSKGQLRHTLDDASFDEMEARDPFVALVRQVRKTMAQLTKRSLVIDKVNGRHYFGSRTFGSITGRTQCTDFVYGGPKWLRFLIVPRSSEHVLVSIDYSAQEVGIAAAVSGDKALAEIYSAKDCHLAFAIRAGAAPADATKASHANVRKQYKSVNLGVLYGQTCHGIGDRLGVSKAGAQALIDDHKRMFPTFWKWSESIQQQAFDLGYIHTACGWRCKVPAGSKERTWMNWPIQAAGADIMRLVAIFLERQHVELLATIHDGFLVSCRKDQIEQIREAFGCASSAAVAHVLPGFNLKWDFEVFVDRYYDEDGKGMWDRLCNAVKEPK